MNRKVSKMVLHFLLIAIIILGAFYIASLAGESELIKDYVSRYGYIGLFITALISGFNLLIPIPAVAFLPLFIESGLYFWPSIFLPSR